MKTYIFILLSYFSLINAMEEQESTQNFREWDAQAYANGNLVQKKAALCFLQESGMTIKNKTVLDIGCGTGDMAREMALSAKHVHAFDASQNMISYLQQKNDSLSNLTSEQCFAENFIPNISFDRATSFFCLHWIENKLKVFKNINKSLKNKGEFLGTIITTADPEAIGITVAREMIPGMTQIHTFLKDMDVLKNIGESHPTDEEFREIIENTGFEIISYKQQSLSFPLNRTDIENCYWPIVMSRPFLQYIPKKLQEWLFSQYIELLLSKLQKNENELYIFPAVNTTVFHLRKCFHISDDM